MRGDRSSGVAGVQELQNLRVTLVREERNSEAGVRIQEFLACALQNFTDELREESLTRESVAQNELLNS
jgi:hypothetical protein